MKYVYVVLFIFLLSCGYPDIDSVPEFENLDITNQESIDLCKLSYADKKDLEMCLLKIDEKNDKADE